MFTLIWETKWPINRSLLLVTLALLLFVGADSGAHPAPPVVVLAIAGILFFCKIASYLPGPVSHRVVFGKKFLMKRPGLAHSMLFIGMITITMAIGTALKSTFGGYLVLASMLVVAAVFLKAAYALTRLAFALVAFTARLLWSWHGIRQGRP